MDTVRKPVYLDQLTEIILYLIKGNLYSQVMEHVQYIITHRLLLFNVASQMWLLGRLLPLIIGEYVPNDDSHWKCYAELLAILVLSTAVEVPFEVVDELRMMVENYLFSYNSLYPNSMTPKMHYLLHLPEQIRQ